MAQTQSVLPGANDLLELAASPVQVIEHPTWIAARETALALIAAGPCMIVLLGPPGSGKTMLLRNLATTLDAQGRTARVLEFADNQTEVGAADVVLIDEADRIDPDRLEELSVSDHGPRSLVLATLPAAGERFCDHPGAIVIRLAPLSPDQACAFLAERLAQLELPVACLTEAAWAGLVLHAHGAPRLLIALLGLSLFVAAEDKAEQVSGAHVEQAVAVRIGGAETADADAGQPEPGPAASDGQLLLADASPAAAAGHLAAGRSRRRHAPAAAVLVLACLLVPATLLTGGRISEPVGPKSDKSGPSTAVQVEEATPADEKTAEIVQTTPVAGAPSAPAAVPAPEPTTPAPTVTASDEDAAQPVASPTPTPAPVAAPPTAPPDTNRPASQSAAAPVPAATAPATVAPPAAPPTTNPQAVAPVPVVTKPPDLPTGAVTHVVLIYPRGDSAAAQRGRELAQELRSDGFGVGEPFPVPSQASKRGISYYFAQDEGAAGEIGRRLGGDYGDGKLVRPRHGAGLPRPGTIEIAVGSR